MSDRFHHTQDQIEGTLEEAKGQGKQTWGEATGDEQAQTEGQGEKLKGKGKQALGEAKEQVGKLKDKLPG